MSARELIEEAGIDWGIFHLRLFEDRCSVLVTLNQWEQSDPPTSFGTLEVKIAEKTAFRIGKLLVKKGEDPAIAVYQTICEHQPWNHSQKRERSLSRKQVWSFIDYNECILSDDSTALIWSLAFSSCGAFGELVAKPVLGSRFCFNC